ncbi:putative cyclin-dependent serine/threonine-protein kinase DDB_G0272797/DDB_G0274007 [Tribolium madens]|uniref:putative cyclin-dependent serine/threonine-protein kinase DDB_G0272797/DDB_G0274007 n=1 Tax=Tribolium madens TaxID=41895 RepID=UPI001CF73BC9|nr:putative cyclin-dependent serine/threonine-protein kinase DDB_G0272797/DDB_G0274007 [Tribolium madens]
MNTMVIIPLILCIVQASAVDKQEKAKTTSSPSNTIQSNQKYEMFYHPIKYQQPVQQFQQLQLQPDQQPIHQYQQLQQLNQKTQYVPVQIIQKPFFVPHSQPQAMIIIAQPALVPQSLVYSNPTQQLLNYFHSNPQAKYQLLHGNYQQTQTQTGQAQTVQPTATYMHPVLATPSNYILTAAPQYQQVATPQYQTLAPQQQLVTQTSPIPTPAVQYSTQQQSTQLSQLAQQSQQQHQHPAQLSQLTQQSQQQHQQPTRLSHLAHLAQLAAQQYVSTQMKTAPAIVTGFEHFTPEQQAQIKAQLSSHLGTNFHAVSSPNQYSAKYVAEQDNNNNSNFVPSPQIKSEPVTTISSQTGGDILKTRYVKGKN